eukprot:NODE_1207_length_1522_cov_4.023761_g1002_i0.p6 GENE.NODE_1207_length_1522_cov_4.023761_g1002_i0~~NODE_1207_length_1522_cov_4.023761_g1002_i0.p6  ORF type:complete len:76 (+),score=15.81 NODE_1207_length_1522_cov_4.023761_g1002_i0:579-806(+)
MKPSGSPSEPAEGLQDAEKQLGFSTVSIKSTWKLLTMGFSCLRDQLLPSLRPLLDILCDIRDFETALQISDLRGG